METRSIIKEEALKEINFDTDVLYLLIKDMIIENGSTIKEALSEYVDINKLNTIEAEFPTLTIFVPTLVENIFSAENWDIQNQIPAVTYLSSKTRTDLPILLNGEFVDTFFENEIPGSPIVVVKENERIVKANTAKFANSTPLRSINSSSTQLVFLDNVFNNQDRVISTRNSTNSGLKTREDYQYLMDAFDEFGLHGWQRDNIYYGLTAQNTKGPLNRVYGEFVQGFEMRGDGLSAVRKISDQAGDPELNEVIKGGRNGAGPAWTDGEFEFIITVHLGTKSPIGNIFETYFRLSPDKLFRPVYEGVKKGGVIDVTKLYLKNVILKKHIFNTPIPLFTWDLEKYSPTIKITIEEVDISTSVTTTFTQTSEFATNFSFDVTFGENVKSGLKFGGSTKDVTTNTFTIVEKLENDQLGEVIVNFDDPVIISKNDKSLERGGGGGRRVPDYDFEPDYNPRYYTDWYCIYIAPANLYE